VEPEAILLGSYATAIALGGILLWLPVSHRAGVDVFDAFFTATSAACVTGLVVVDTGIDFTLFGQAVILLLIELGGLGVMTFAALAFDLLGRRLSLSGQEAMTGALVHESMVRGFRLHFLRMLRLVLLVEASGALLLFAGMVPDLGFAKALYAAVFHAVSAFCNAGFSLYPDSLTGFRGNLPVMLIMCALIVVGGIGHPVLFDLRRALTSPTERGRGWTRRFTIHTRITVVTTIILLIAGFVLLAVTGLQPGALDLADAAFQSVAARTAGFNTVVIGQLPLASLLVLTVLMFIGGSPGSCAGGVKTTTFALWSTQLWARLRGGKGVVVSDRYIPQQLVRRSSTIIGLALVWNALGVFVLSITESGGANPGLHHLLFEQISAFGTVGLSTGLTPHLSHAGRLWIMATMFAGRTGPLTGVLLLLRRRPCAIRYPEGRVMIG
jgi:trk system potassium uptake protein TrkH